MELLWLAVILMLRALILIGDGVIFTSNFLLLKAKQSKKKIDLLLQQLLQSTMPHKIKKQTVIYQRAPKKSQAVRSMHLPKIQLPKITIPTIYLPKLHAPNVSLPKFRLPKLAIPKIRLPRLILPTITLPKPRLPRLHLLAKKKPAAPTVSPRIFPFFVKFKYFLTGVTFSFIFLFLPLLAFIFVQDLPSPKALSLGNIPQTTKIYDRNNTLLYQIYANQNRTLVPLSQIPRHLRLATIAIEDEDFYNHLGFDMTAIIRSALNNVQGQNLQGGSTITQQLIKSSLLTPETKISRKIKEVILAFWAERMYTKDEILSMYFNQIPYGGTAWGVEAAAEVYFNKKVENLSLAESAFLAGIPRAPSIYSPYGSTPNAWKKRQKEVLNRMVANGFISTTQAGQAYNQELQFARPQTPLHAPHFVMYVRDLLIQRYGLPLVERGGLTVITSLDLKTQDMAQNIVTDEVFRNAYLNLTNGAAVVTNPKNGDILAMVGGKDFSSEEEGAKYNVPTAERQPGSSIKILTYSAALSQGFTAATILDDAPVTFRSPGSPSYTPANYDGKSHGRVPLRQAFANSFNITAVRTLNQIGIPTMVDLGKKMGIKSWGEPEEYGLAITLGSAETTMLDMATVYGTVANGGKRVDINPILKITDYKGNVLEEKKEPIPSHQVLDGGVAFIVSNILSDNSARAQSFGSNSVLNIPGKTVSVKTGTSDWKKDNWTDGYTPSRVTVVWVGNNNGSAMSQSLASGVTGAAPIWNKIMTNLLKDLPDELPRKPDNVVQKFCLGRQEYFIVGTENSVNCNYKPPKPTEKKGD